MEIFYQIKTHFRIQEVTGTDNNTESTYHIFTKIRKKSKPEECIISKLNTKMKNTTKK